MGTTGGESAEPFGGFEVAIRNFSLKTTELRIRRKWLREDTEDGAAKFDLEIGGKARSRDAVVIIGETNSTTDFHFHLNTDDPAKSWADSKETLRSLSWNFEDESTPERKLQNYIYGKLDQAPPTATLFWYETDPEIGIKESWVIECTIPKEVRDQLVQDILAGKANEISIDIKWVGGLVFDKHAPPSIPTTWGLFRTEPDESPEPLHGQVESLTWELTLPRVGSP